VDPIPDIDSGTPSGEFADDLARFGMPRAYASALAEAAYETKLFPSDDDDLGYTGHDPEMAARIAIDKYKSQPKGSPAALLMALEGIYRSVCYNDRTDVGRFRPFVASFAKRLGIDDFGPAFRGLDEKGRRKLDRDFRNGIVEIGLARPETTIDFDVIRSRSADNLTFGDPQADCCLPEFWLCFDPERALRAIVAAFLAEPDDTAPEFIKGFDATLRRWFDHERHVEIGETQSDVSSLAIWEFWEGQAWREAALLLEPVVASLAERAARCPDDTRISGTWLYYVYRVFSHRPDALAPEMRDKALAVANMRLGRIRPVLASADTDEGREAFEAQQSLLHYSALVLMYFGSTWKALKPLLLALRRLRAVSVSDDLRYWPQPGDGDNAPPYPWREIPTWISAMLHHGLPMEQESGDDKLVGIREDFARFILERLRPKQKPAKRGDRELRDEDMLEGEPVWRLNYVKALRALRISPDGIGHRAINWVRRNDPSEEVRREADAAYDELRHDVRIPEGTSPRRLLFAAVLWLRRAHLEALGGTPDDDGARRTYGKEVRRTKETR